MVTVIFSSSFFLISLVSHTRSLLTKSSHRILGLACLVFPSTFWASALFAIVSYPILSTVPLSLIASNIPTQKQQFHKGAFVRICILCLSLSCSSLFYSYFVLVLVSLASAFYLSECVESVTVFLRYWTRQYHSIRPTKSPSNSCGRRRLMTTPTTTKPNPSVLFTTNKVTRA